MQSQFPGNPRIAVLIPCRNEERTVAAVVRDFRRAIPASDIYVYDNNSTDDTRVVAAQAGAIVRAERYQGKGNVVRRMFSDIVADIYIMVDGDGTYDAQAAPVLVQKLIDGQLDMVCGIRRSSDSRAFRLGHRFGNRLLTGLVQLIFGRGLRDMLTGYRVFSQRFVKSFPGTSRGFEIETELNVYALQMRLPTDEVETSYGARPENSTSKLSTVRDGIAIFRMIGVLVKEEKPLLFFGTLASLVAFVALAIFAPVLIEYWRTGLVPRFPTLIVAVGAGVLAGLLLTSGVILDTVARARMESRRLSYLAASMLAPPLQAREGQLGGTGAHVLPASASLRAEGRRSG
jgi:glycosyltransferase involved in cell wall biosynthesis